VDHPPTAVRLVTRISDVAARLRTAFSPSIVPSVSVHLYKHCGSAGQAECGRNLTRRFRTRFKHAFEIGKSRIGAAVNHLCLPPRSRDFAPEPPANRRAAVLCW
jgi:hypothetical protein